MRRSHLTLAISLLAVAMCAWWFYARVLKEYTLELHSDQEVTVQVSCSVDAPWVTYEETGTEVTFTLSDVDYWDVSIIDSSGIKRDNHSYDLSQQHRKVVVKDFLLQDR